MAAPSAQTPHRTSSPQRRFAAASDSACRHSSVKPPRRSSIACTERNTAPSGTVSLICYIYDRHSDTRCGKYRTLRATDILCRTSGLQVAGAGKRGQHQPQTRAHAYASRISMQRARLVLRPSLPADSARSCHRRRIAAAIFWRCSSLSCRRRRCGCCCCCCCCSCCCCSCCCCRAGLSCDERKQARVRDGDNIPGRLACKDER